MNYAIALRNLETTNARTPQATLRHRVRLYALETHAELLSLLRQPGFTLPALLFPTFFYVVFGVLLSNAKYAGLRGLPTYLLATYSAFGLMNVGLHALGIGVALDRGFGWLTVKRASPMPPAAYFVAKLVTSLLFGAGTFVLLALLGVTLGGVRLPLGQWLALGGLLLAGSLPFAAMGVAVGYLVQPRSVGGLINMIQLPWALASGLWIPIEALPSWWQHAAVVLPPYHYAQLVLSAIGAGHGTPIVHAAVLAGFLVVCLVVARWGYWRAEDS
jgi:ABC-2 type transport system permease protein